MKLTAMSMDALVSRFEELCLKQYDADLSFDMPRYNRAFDAMMARERRRYDDMVGFLEQLSGQRILDAAMLSSEQADIVFAERHLV